MLWWLALHGLLVAAVLVASLSVLANVVLLIAVGAHARLRYPKQAPLLLYAGGVWALPRALRFNLALGPGTRYSSWWVCLDLENARSHSPCLVFRDQLDAESWRRLQVKLREHGGAAAGRPR